MWASTLALNGYTGFGRIYNGDWGVHALGHVLSLLFDVPHGASLTIVYPAWLKYHSEKAKERIEKLGTLLFNNPSVENTILGIEQFFVKIGCPVRLAEAGIASSAKSKIIEVMKKNSSSGTSWLLTAEDYPELLRLME
jgi:alcohol dehydrogenase YqhD (iron-dependent ADH family)